MRQRNYCLATWDTSLDDHEEQKVPVCFAFIGIRSNKEAADALGAKLGIEPRPWLSKGHWCVAWDYVVGQGIDPFKEIQMTLWEWSSLGIEFSWCRDLMPEMPQEMTNKTKNNCFQSLEQALEAFARISPSANPDLLT